MKKFKISFRSQGDFDVNQFARNHFFKVEDIAMPLVENQKCRWKKQ
jgi:hypothetical protein